MNPPFIPMFKVEKKSVMLHFCTFGARKWFLEFCMVWFQGILNLIQKAPTPHSAPGIFLINLVLIKTQH